MSNPSDRVSPVNITEIMQTAYIDYSMSVIVSRALPDARDGLKPVQRRILYAMLREGLLHNRSFDKCAGVVGEVLKNYHPHGDSSVYDTLVRLAQSWVMRAPLIEPQGNFGSVDGDPPAAYRYTECRLAQTAEDLLRDIDEDTVDFIANYKESTTEPTVLPSALPNLLLNGSTGIAVGMATNIPPHNIGELIDATCAVIDDPAVPIRRLMELMPGPDFPTAGIIAGTEGIQSYMLTGRGIVRIRGRVITEEMKNGRERIIITEIPYNVNRANLVTTIAQLVTDKRIDEISDLRDESDENTRIVIELKRGEQSQIVVNKLHKMTQLENSFGVILLALDNRRPKQMNIKELIECYVAHRREVVTRRTEFRLRQAEDRAHILEGYKIALDNLDDFVRIIRASANKEEARVRLMEKYPLSERQANAILELRLYQLTGLEREKIEAEYMELMRIIDELRAILASEARLMALIKQELLVLKERHASPRRTELVPAEGELRMEDVIANVGCVITVSHQGFIKRTPVADYRVQKRGGKGVIGTETYDTDFVSHLFTASTHDYILFVTSAGQCLAKKVYEVPEGARTSKGKSVASFLSLGKDEKIAAMVCFTSFEEERYLVLATHGGIVKKTRLSEYEGATREREGGLNAINLREGDNVIGGVLTTGTDEVILVSRLGLAVRFQEGPLGGDTGEPEPAEADTESSQPEEADQADDAGTRYGLRPMGRATGGVTGMRFKKPGDYLEAIEVCDPAARLLIAREDGVGKRTPFSDYRLIRRGGTGVKAIELPDDGSIAVAGALAVRDSDQIMLLTAAGQSVRTRVREIRETGRNARGPRLVNLGEGDKLLAIARVVESDEEEEAAEESAAQRGPETPPAGEDAPPPA